MPADTAVASWWPRARRLLGAAFMLLVLGLLFKLARGLDWPAAITAVSALPASTLALAAALALASYAVYCSYDLIGRQQTGHGLTAPQVVSVGFISYAFNLNLGALVGGVAFRYRLYSKLGLDTATVTRVLGLSLLTNWLGYLCLGGLVFLLRPPALPPAWGLGSTGLRLLGAGLLLAAAVYVGLCFGASRRLWRLRGHEVTLPSGRIALLQLGLSSLNWLLIAAVSHTLLQQRIDYPTVLAVLLMAAVTGVVTHVPAGLGVLEAVFVALLSHRVAQGELLGALLAYRAIYYLAPLLLASLWFLGVEMRARRAHKRGADAAPSYGLARPGAAESPR